MSSVGPLAILEPHGDRDQGSDQCSGKRAEQGLAAIDPDPEAGEDREDEEKAARCRRSIVHSAAMPRDDARGKNLVDAAYTAFVRGAESLAR